MTPTQQAILLGIHREQSRLEALAAAWQAKPQERPLARDAPALCRDVGDVGRVGVQVELTTWTMVSQQAGHKALVRLTELGLITRHARFGGERLTCAKLTPAGVALAEELARGQ